MTISKRACAMNAIRQDETGLSRPPTLGGAALAAAVPIALLAVAAGAAHLEQFSFAAMFRDPVMVGPRGLPSYTGMISNLGIVLWVSTAAICLFASGNLGRATAQHDAALSTRRRDVQRGAGPR